MRFSKKMSVMSVIAALSLSSIGYAADQSQSSNQPSLSNNIQFQPMRSMIMVSVRDDSDLPVAYRWLYKDHVPDSISQFAPYVTKYATYRALPLPKNAEDFGTYNWIMTEHYWLINPFNHGNNNAVSGVAFGETYNKEYMEATRQPTDSGLRPSSWQGTKDGYHPTMFAFLPLFWEDDLKGADRTIDDGPNYRWVTAVKYPDGVSQEEGDKWFKEQFLAAFVDLPEVNRVLSSKVLQEPKTGPFQRVNEIWFDNSKKWEAAIEKVKKKVAKPSWATYDKFPYIAPYESFVGEFLLERPESDHLQQYKGYEFTR